MASKRTAQMANMLAGLGAIGATTPGTREGARLAGETAQSMLIEWWEKKKKEAKKRGKMATLGKTVGSTIGSIWGPIGSAIGGTVGGTAGYQLSGGGEESFAETLGRESIANAPGLDVMGAGRFGGKAGGALGGLGDFKKETLKIPREQGASVAEAGAPQLQKNLSFDANAFLAQQEDEKRSARPRLAKAKTALADLIKEEGPQAGKSFLENLMGGPVDEIPPPAGLTAANIALVQQGAREQERIDVAREQATMMNRARQQQLAQGETRIDFERRRVELAEAEAERERLEAAEPDVPSALEDARTQAILKGTEFAAAEASRKVTEFEERMTPEQALDFDLERARGIAKINAQYRETDEKTPYTRISGSQVVSVTYDEAGKPDVKYTPLSEDPRVATAEKAKVNRELIDKASDLGLALFEKGEALTFEEGFDKGLQIYGLPPRQKAAPGGAPGGPWEDIPSKSEPGTIYRTYSNGKVIKFRQKERTSEAPEDRQGVSPGEMDAAQRPSLGQLLGTEPRRLGGPSLAPLTTAPIPKDLSLATQAELDAQEQAELQKMIQEEYDRSSPK